MPSKLIEKFNTSYTICNGRMDQGRQRAKSHNTGKENQGYYRHNCLSMDNHSPSVGKAEFPETKILTPLRLQRTLLSLPLDKDTKLTFHLSFYQSFWESLGSICLPKGSSLRPGQCLLVLLEGKGPLLFCQKGMYCLPHSPTRMPLKGNACASS